jgi:hypothetical protein
MDFTTLPAGARIIDGKLYLPANAEQVAGMQLMVRRKAHGDVPAGAPSAISVPLPVLTGENNGAPSPVVNQVTAAVALPVFTPVAVIDWLAYPFDSANRSHAYAFSGFTTEAAAAGSPCQLKAIGVLMTPPQVVLTPAQHYLGGFKGRLVTEEETGASFVRVIGFALSSNELRVLNLPPIFKA